MADARAVEKLDLAEIPRGEFLMGQDTGRDDERPAHRITVAPFRIARRQVTNSEYDHFCRVTLRPPPPERKRPEFSRPDQPVVGVNWFDARAYCEWLSKVSGVPMRLPSEAEWEFAARGGLDGKLYPWGDEPPEGRLGYRERWREGPEPVGQSEPNGYGLYEMCENVHEWCSDWYDPGYYAQSPVVNPGGPAKGKRRASRGGSWRHHIKIARCAARSSIPPEFRYADYGFRVASDPDR